MRTLKLCVAYDGSCYHGFQKQKNILTIQGVLEEVLSKLCGETITIAGSGRTDACVHALEQTISLRTNGRIPCNNLVMASRSLLPSDIVIKSAQDVDEDFHARFSAYWKVYQYKLIINEYDDPFMVRYAWQIHEHIDIKLMNEAAKFILGTHDFSAFKSSGSVDSSPIKTIYTAFWYQENNELIFRIAGDGFLYHMVRNIVWSLVQVGLKKRTIDDLKKELNSSRGTFLNEPAPPQGLYLAKVFYTPYNENSIKK